MWLINRLNWYVVFVDFLKLFSRNFVLRRSVYFVNNTDVIDANNTNDYFLLIIHFC